MWASLALTTSASLARSMPAASARLLALVGGQPRAVGAPGCGPAWRPARSRRAPWSRSASLMASNTGPDPLDHPGSPPTMHTRSPLAAAAGPPLTPQSSTGTPSAGGLGAEGPDARGRDGAHDDDGGVRTGGGQAAVGAGQHGVDLLVVDHGHHDDVGTARPGRPASRHRGAVARTARWPRPARRTPPAGTRLGGRWRPHRPRWRRARSPRRSAPGVAPARSIGRSALDVPLSIVVRCGAMVSAR